MKYTGSLTPTFQGASEVHSIKADKMSSGNITNDEGLKMEAVSDLKISFGVHESFLSSENFNFCYLFSPAITNPTDVGLVEMNLILIQIIKYCTFVWYVHIYCFISSSKELIHSVFIDH